ncbi:MAG TPA: serine/threonine-protein kinase, partial [Planctomycetaceae bacterium]|nr:serine/threonine-protein kinase [Planctomycetaceae bacterium]
QMDIVQTLRWPGEIVPGYELLSVIGHGGMGVVYRARQRTLDRVVAIKTILISQVADPQMSARFEQEARAVARLQHPNIISAIDFGQHDGRLFFVMELVQGEDLEALIERQRQLGSTGPATEELAWGLARQAASGLAHAAEQGIVHRDIKPANLLLVEPPAGFPLPPGMPLVKIADFGLAFLTSTEAEAKTRLTAANTTVGSPHYIAPEQLSGSTVDGRADIYALGATVFHLLAGQPPYSGLGLAQILTQKLTADSPRLKSVRRDISDATDLLVSDMMARRSEQRIGSYAELLQRIDDHLPAAGVASWSGLSAGSSLMAGSSSLGTEMKTVVMSRPIAPSPIAATTMRQAPASDTKPLSESNAFVSTRPSTQEIAVTPATSRRLRRRTLFALVGIAVVGGVGAFVARWLRGGSNRPQMVPTGWSEPLFDGRSLRFWQPRGGTWQLAQDDDGANVLSGTNGVVARRLIRGDAQPPQPLEHFALTLAVRLHQARAIELHFGLLIAKEGNGPRLALRVEKETAWIAYRLAELGSSQPRTKPVPLPAADAERPRVLRLIRDATHWFAFVDEQAVGTVPLSGQPEFAEFRLLADGGPAWFSDVEVMELHAPATSPE